MTIHRRSLVAALLSGAVCALVGSSPAATPLSPPQPFEQVFARFNVQALPTYRAFRRMEAGLRDSDKQAWLEAWTEYTPSTGLSCTRRRGTFPGPVAIS